jgi:uncharacterized secreted protein with C-terminal beta-propeller domain
MPDPTQADVTDRAAALAVEKTDLAALLAEQTRSRATELAQQRETAAVALAELRGRESANVQAQLVAHEDHLKVVNGSIARTGSAVEAVTSTVTALAGTIDGH